MRASAGVGVGCALAVLGAVVLVFVHRSGVAPLGAVVLACGAATTLTAARHLALLSHARPTLREAPLRLALDRHLDRRSRCGWSTTLRSRDGDGDGDEQTIGTFGFEQSSIPISLRTESPAPALLYGEPRRGSVVIVSCDRGVLVGRLRTDAA